MDTEAGARHGRVAWAAAVVGVVLLAFFVRSYFSLETATSGNDFKLSESDAYYHKHTVDKIQASGFHHAAFDPLINYPHGGVNPNPPLWTWWIAVWGQTLAPSFSGEPATGVCTGSPDPALCVSTWWVTVTSPALFGALTVLVVYFIAARVWNRRAGIFAAFFLATMAGSIERSVLGFADHDSITLFFIVVSFYFYVRALQALREAFWVERWPSGGISGIATCVRENKLALAFAGLSGMGIGATALVWKGAPYAMGILMAYAGLQLLLNHWRGKDSLALVLVTLFALLVGVLVPLPAYVGIGEGFVGHLNAGFYMVVILALVGGIFVVTRDFPSVLVFPLFLLASAGALLAMFFLLPQVASILLDPIVYFRGTKLYQTIAEANPADFNFLVFNTGLGASFLAFLAIPYVIYRERKSLTGVRLFVIVWAIVAIYMAYSTVRFTFNATPAFAILAGWLTGHIVSLLGYEQIGKTMAGLRGEFVYTLRRAVGAWHVIGAILIASLLILPSVWMAVDAGLPIEAEQKLAEQDRVFAERFGAFGQGFIPSYWRELFAYLAAQDSSLPAADRPAFLSWWDYGHWAASIGDHPAVADNFQNGYAFAGNFITSQNETHAIQLLSARLMELADDPRTPGYSRDTFVRILRELRVSSEGRYAVHATADAAGLVSEISEQNNELTKGFAVLDAGAEGADVAVEQLAFQPADPAPGGHVSLVATLRNRGASAARDLTVRFLLNETVVAEKNVSELAPASVQTVTADRVTGPQGYARAAVTLEVPDAARDATQADDRLAKTLVAATPGASGADLVVEDVTWEPAAPKPGDLIAFSVAVRNRGNEGASNVTIRVDVDGTRMGDATIASLGAGDRVTVSGPAWRTIGPGQAYDDLRAFRFVPESAPPTEDLLSKPKALELLKRVESATNKRIRYFAVDVRMFPFDIPDCEPASPNYSPTIDAGSIFYAPVTLADKSPDDFIERVVQFSQGGNTREVSAAEFQTIQRDVRQLGSIESFCEKYRFKDPYLSSMFYRAYIGTPAGARPLGPSTPLRTDPTRVPSTAGPEGVGGDRLVDSSIMLMPGYGLENFRVVFLNGGSRMLRFHQGAELSGSVTSGSQPLGEVTVVAFDDAGRDVWPHLGNIGPFSFRPAFAHFEAVRLMAGELPADLRGRIGEILGVNGSELEAGVERTLETLRALETAPPPEREVAQLRAQGASGNISRVSDLLSGLPVEDPGIRVLARAFDIPHRVATTNATGIYTLRVPFSVHDNITVRFFKDGAEIGNLTRPVALEQAEAGARLAQGDLVVPPGSVTGIAFDDANGNRVLDAGEGVEGVTLGIEGTTLQATSGADGRYRIDGVPPGQHSLTAEHALYAERFPVTIFVGPGQEAAQDVALGLKPVPTTGTVWFDADGNGALGAGEGVSGTIHFVAHPPESNRAQNATAPADESGAFTTNLVPGEYVGRLDNATSNATLALTFRLLPGQGDLAIPATDTRLTTAARVTGTVEANVSGNLTGTRGVALRFEAIGGGVSSVLHAAQLTNATGGFGTLLAPGLYRVTGILAITGQTYSGEASLVVGQQPVTDFRLVLEARTEGA